MKNELLERRADLLSELQEVERQIEDEATMSIVNARREQGLSLVFARFHAGEYIINSNGRVWWCDANGDLVELAETWEFEAAQGLVKLGVLEKITHG